jgi:predicted nucleic acid-binding protein
MGKMKKNTEYVKKYLTINYGLCILISMRLREGTKQKTGGRTEMAGYNGYSKSNNAVGAESEGRYPMTRAKQVVAEKAGVSQVTAERILWVLHRGEFHHTSKKYNSTNYYDATAAIWIIALAKLLEIDPTDALFLATCRAHGLNQGEYDRSNLDKVEFLADYREEKWKYLVK